tara:strand:+ start:875 stop:1072 length:198 start_codon:yes stop_codon:yes gene_type:complete
LRLKKGRNKYADVIITIGSTIFGKNLNQDVLKLSAGYARNVIELIEVPIILKPITHPEYDLFPTK